MKLLVISCLVALAAADVSHVSPKDEAGAVIQFQEAEVNPDSYAWKYETSNGIKANEQGQLLGQGEGASLDVHGENSYYAPGGELIETKYEANQNGYQPTGSHIPTPPPIPEVILRSLEYIRAHPPKEEKY